MQLKRKYATPFSQNILKDYIITVIRGKHFFSSKYEQYVWSSEVTIGRTTLNRFKLSSNLYVIYPYR